MCKKPYRLDKPYVWDEETDTGDGGCVFCGKTIEHINDGGVGWILEAKGADGMMREYLYCCNPMCPEVEANDQQIHRCHNPNQERGWKLDPTQTYDACDDFGHYSEFVGDTCPDCGGTPAEVDARLYDPSWTEFFAAGKKG